MITLLSKNKVTPEKEAEFLKIASGLVEATRKEEGCIFYELSKDIEDPYCYYFVEKYVDYKAVEAHRASAHFKKWVPMMAECRKEPSELTELDSVL